MEWSAGAVAKMLGISPTTLRTWDRRYGLGPTAREEGKHRRYSSADVERLKRMVDLTGSGVSPASAAASLVAEVSPVAGDFVVAASLLDAVEMRRVAVDLIARHGVVHTWDAVLMPFLVELGQRVSEEARRDRGRAHREPQHRRRDAGVTGARARLGAARLRARRTAQPAAGRACRGVGRTWPRGSQPGCARARRCAGECRRTAEAAGRVRVGTRSDVRRTGAVGGALGGVPRRVATPPVALSVLVGGPGWGDVPLPPGVRWVDTLTVAVETILDRI